MANPTASGLASSLDPFAGGQMQMNADLFKQATDVLKTPPGSAARRGLNDQVFAACMVVDLRQDALKSVAGTGRNGHIPPQSLWCPTCNVAAIEDKMNQSFLCTMCGRGVSFSLMSRLFLQSPATVGYSGGFISAPPGANKKKTTNLTDSLPRDVEPDPEQLKAKTVETKEPLVMWRSWRIALKDEPYLASSNHKVPWPKKEPIKAEHQGSSRPGDGGHQSPDWHCGCGVYAVKTLVQAQAWSRPVSGFEQALGRVAMWGKVHLYSEGARSEYAYPKEIWIPAGEFHEEAKKRLDESGWTAQRLADTLAASYGIEVHMDDGMFNLGLRDG